MDDRKIGVAVIGGGLAGCEAAWQIARAGVAVRLYEMKPEKMSPAHHSPMMAELVCSNSLRSAALTNASGLLKEELRRLGSLIIEAADATSVPAGSALAVDREHFAAYITEKIASHPLIETCRREVSAPGDEPVTVIATGPLTSPTLSANISELLGREYLSFFDAAAPIVEASSIDMSRAFIASRYDKGEACYINCPMEKDEYDAFYDALIAAPLAQLKDFDAKAMSEPNVFEGCMPVEIMARRGRDTLRYGPMKPVGLPDPRTGNEPYAVLQLRQENSAATMYNLVGFQTHLTFEAQRQVFSMIPGLSDAIFLRYGVMHRNTYIDSPRLLQPDYSLRDGRNIFFAGQISGVEGYIESTSSGWLAGINAARRSQGEPSLVLPDKTVIGALAHYVSDTTVGNFQPMNANFGIVAPPESRIRGPKIKKYEYYAQRSLEYIDNVACGRD